MAVRLAAAVRTLSVDSGSMINRGRHNGRELYFCNKNGTERIKEISRSRFAVEKDADLGLALCAELK